MFQVVTRHEGVRADNEYGIIEEVISIHDDLDDAFIYCEDILKVSPRNLESFTLETALGNLVVAKTKLPKNPLHKRIYHDAELLVVDTEATPRSIYETRLTVMDHKDLVELTISLLMKDDNGKESTSDVSPRVQGEEG